MCVCVSFFCHIFYGFLGSIKLLVYISFLRYRNYREEKKRMIFYWIGSFCCLGSKSVVKYPKCSIRRQSTFADAKVYSDLSVDYLKMFLLNAPATVVALGFHSLYFVAGSINYKGNCKRLFYFKGVSLGSQTLGVGFLALLNNFIFLGLGVIIGYPIASASVKVLQGLWRNDLVALKGACPNCGEEVFAFVRMDRNIESPHRADCHVCECVLEFRTKVEVAN
ncbi:PGR5-like protein 1A, chloroplastic isoform X2 [Vigna unguiculata]|uniref:PGR5-like protein 1A, chloroplastic isoform X2 n=1 Tax=Vigna unguiculata TaxID=3917 RepID=UPI00101630D9|nr:PGR5-like protein 1A, chloroplastic isoform X2 [Vigna unguiculata]